MKKILILLGIFLLPATSFAAFDVNAKYGQKGDAVYELQDLLVDEGCLAVSPTGYFGLLTVKAVKCFQAKHALPSTGFWGPLSRTVANDLVGETLAGATQEDATPAAEPTPSQIGAKLDALTAQVEAIKSTNPVPKPIMEPVDLSAITIKRLRVPSDSVPVFSFTIEVKGKDGQTLSKPAVTISATRNGVAFDQADTTSAAYSYAFLESSENPKVYGVGYNPFSKGPGTYVFTFTSNGMTKTEEVVVQ